MYFKDNIENTIIDDNNIEINTLRLEDQSSNGDRYFIKKIKKIRELSRNTSTVIVIDNFSGEVDSDLRELLTTGCKIILITRSTPSYQNCHKLQINSISDYESLLQIFEKNLGRRITKEEESDFHEIVEYIDGHTFVLELIAKQIANNGKLTITSASELTKKHGFSSIAPEKVSIEMDNQTKSDTIANIIDELFKAGNLTENQKIFMKVASLIGDKGIDINYFHQILKIECKDDANELIKDGWLMFADEKISMHRVIQDSIQRWEWTPAYLSMAECFLSYFYIEIHLESTKNNYPRKLRDNLLLSEKLQSLAMQKGKIYKKFYERFNLMIEKQEQKTLIGRVAMEREKRIHDTNPADLKKLMALLSQAEDIITKCKRDQIIKNTEVYVNLLYVTLLNTPDYKEDYILDETTDMFSNDNFDFIRKGTDELIESDLSRNAITLFRLYAKVILVHAERGRIEESEIMLEQANRFSKSARHSRVTALYYNLLSNFYDILLNGAYDTTDSNEEFLLNNMLDAIDKTLQYSKKFISRDEDHLYANNILAKATILMRSGRGKKEEIEKLLETAQKVVSENTSPYADVRLVFYLVYAWYFALLLNSGEAADICIQKAKGLSDYILQNSLQKIEMIIIPCANIYFETGMHKEATTLLHEGISLCAKYPNNEFYAQIKRELCDHIWEVAREFGEYDLCNTIIAEIDHDNESVVDSKNKVVIPEDVRLLISTNTTN